jgi:hypothetical protein
LSVGRRGGVGIVIVLVWLVVLIRFIVVLAWLVVTPVVIYVRFVVVIFW